MAIIRSAIKMVPIVYSIWQHGRKSHTNNMFVNVRIKAWFGQGDSLRLWNEIWILHDEREKKRKRIIALCFCEILKSNILACHLVLTGFLLEKILKLQEKPMWFWCRFLRLSSANWDFNLLSILRVKRWETCDAYRWDGSELLKHS